MSEDNESLGLVAYNFEPEYTQEEFEMREQLNESEGTAVFFISDWCFCQECEEMPTCDECCWCRSTDYVLPNIGELECITDHEQFSLLVLNPDLLAVAYIQIMMYKGLAGRAPENLSNV